MQTYQTSPWWLKNFRIHIIIGRTTPQKSPKQRDYHILHTSISNLMRRKRQRCECRVIYEDDKHAVHLYNAVNDQLLHLEEVSLGLAIALWDAADPNLFLLSDGQVLYTFLYSPVSLHGAGEHTHACCLCCVSGMRKGLPNVQHPASDTCPCMKRDLRQQRSAVFCCSAHPSHWKSQHWFASSNSKARQAYTLPVDLGCRSWSAAMTL